MRATSRARQVNRASPVRESKNRYGAKAIWADFPPAAPAPPGVSRVPRTWACYFTTFLHTSNVILTIPGEHGENIDPLC